MKWPEPNQKHPNAIKPSLELPFRSDSNCSSLAVDMTVVAVAGGTGGIGKTIIEQLVLSGKHEVLVLSRHVSESQVLEVLVVTKFHINDSNMPKVPDHPSQDGAQLIRADYGDVGSLTRLLELNNVDTVISAIGMHSEATEKAQLNLIEAAKQSEKTKRFIPSEYGACNTLEYTPPNIPVSHICTRNH